MPIHRELKPPNHRCFALSSVALFALLLVSAEFYFLTFVFSLVVIVFQPLYQKAANIGPDTYGDISPASHAQLSAVEYFGFFVSLFLVLFVFVALLLVCCVWFLGYLFI